MTKPTRNRDSASRRWNPGKTAKLSGPIRLFRWSVVAVISAVLAVGLGFDRAAAQEAGFGALIEVTGEVDVLHIDDYARGRSSYRYVLHDAASGKQFDIKFGRAAPKGLLSGDVLTVRGNARGRAIEVHETIAAMGGASTEADAGADSAALTERRALILMVDLTDAFASNRYTIDQITGQMFTGSQNVDQLYRTSSYGQMSFPPDTDGDGAADVFGPFAIDAPSNVCDYYDWAYKAEAAADAAGIDISLYDHRVYIVPRYNDQACTWGGVANVGCNRSDSYRSGFCRSWIAEGESGAVYAHELGHNLNMAHASTDPGNDGTVDSEYGDYSDPMGLSRTWHVFNAPHIQQMNWFDATDNTIVDVSATGDFTLFPVEEDFGPAAGPRALRIAKPDSSDYYYLSVREPVGSYGSLSSTYTRGVNIHRYRGSGYNRTLFIRSLYDDGSGSGATLEFVDTTNEITITQLADNGDGTVDVRVDFNVECLTAPPLVNINPAIVASVPAGSDDFNVTVTNRDTSVCDARAFEVAMDVDTPLWSGTPFDNTGVLAPGVAVTLSFTVRADDDALDGTYVVSAEAYDATDSTISLASYMVDGSPPDTPELIAVLTRKNRASLSWTASQDDGVGLDHYEVYSNGTLIATTTSTSYNHTGLVSGATYSYVVDAVDGADNAASSNAAEVTTQAKGGGGGSDDGGGGGSNGGNKGKKPPK